MSDTNPAVPSVRWHHLDVDDSLVELNTSLDGLTNNEAHRRLGEFGPNEITESASISKLRLIWAQISSVMVLILIGAAALSLALGKLLEAGAIAAIVVLFAALGFVQEYRAEQAIAALRRMSVPLVRTRRDGRVVEVPSADLVPGDVVALDAGAIVPADLRLLEAASLRVEEAALTGESEPVDKQTDAVEAAETALGDRRCMAYSGTQVAAGRGVGLVVATGMQTELGKIATLLQDVGREDTPLQQRLDRVGKQLAAAGVIVAALVAFMGALAGETAADLALTAISVAVAVIPEGLPAVVTFTLALGAQRMLRRQALIRRLPAVETLGSVTVICTDKTGTLTQNLMTATTFDVAGRTIDLNSEATQPIVDLPVAAQLMAVAGVLCNDGHLELDAQGTPVLTGDPTETALLRAAHDAGLDTTATRTVATRIGELPFDSTRKRMSTIHDATAVDVVPPGSLGDGHVAFVKGAVDGLIDRTTAVWTDDGSQSFDEGWRNRIVAANDRMASNGMRVLAVAMRMFAPGTTTDDMVAGAESDLTLLGLVGIIDPPRPEVRSAVARCRSAGIRSVMITGDHPLTALAIARDLGMVPPAAHDPAQDHTDGHGTHECDGGPLLMTGLDIDRATDAAFDQAVATVSVFARVTPEHKLRIVEALQRQHQVVAMTGDGVNDAPALKRSDIGVAMGITGTDVSKEASDMVLRDDNFTTIVAAVEEGRVIYDNLRRFVSFAVAGNLGKIIVMLGWPIPYLLTGGEVDAAVALLPLQLLWLNLMTDGLLGLSMGVEPAEPNVMQRAPHRPGASLWVDGLGRRTIWIGVAIGLSALGVGIWYHENDIAQWQTMIFTTVALMQVFQAFATRSQTESLRRIGWRSNAALVAVAAVVVALQLVAIYSPLNGLLDLEPLTAIDLLVCVALGMSLLIALELVKALERRRRTSPVDVVDPTTPPDSADVDSTSPSTERAVAPSPHYTERART